MDEIRSRFYKQDLSVEKSSAELTHEFFDMWSKTYEATYGRLLEMPAMGPTRERSEKLSENLSVSVNLLAVWMDSVVNFHNVFIEAMRRVHETAITEIEKGETDGEIYRDFYKVWIKTYSETFKEFLKSDHFARDMRALTSCFVDFQRSKQELLEENYLKQMRLPTRAEIDEIYKEVYSLKKTVKELTGHIRELSEKK